MNGTDFIALSPLLVLSATPIVVMLAIAIRRDQALSAGISILGMMAAFAAVWAADRVVPRQVTTLLIIDRYALFYIALILFSALVTATIAYSYFAIHEGEAEDFTSFCRLRRWDARRWWRARISSRFSSAWKF